MELKPEQIPRYECKTHVNSGNLCPECKRRSYCNSCVRCLLCSYPNISGTHDSDQRYWIEVLPLGCRIMDRQTGRAYNPRKLFHVGVPRVRDKFELWPHEVAQIIKEIGFENCVAIVQHYYYVRYGELNDPMRKHLIQLDLNEWIEHEEYVRRMEGEARQRST